MGSEGLLPYILGDWRRRDGLLLIAAVVRAPELIDACIRLEEALPAAAGD